MKKKVLHLLSSNSYSGAENVATYIINTLKSEYEMVYASVNGPISGKLEEQNIEYMPMENFSVKNIKKCIEKFKPDIIHAHDFTATVKSAFLNTKIPIVSHIHQNPDWLKTINKNSIILYLVSKKINKVIAVTPALVGSLNKYKKINNKIVVAENIVDIDEIRSKSCGSNSDIYDVIFIGRLVDVKDPMRFIEIVKNLAEHRSETRVAIIGDGYLKKECIEAIKEFKLEKNIDFKGFQNNPFPILKNSKLLVMTSKSEGLPMTAIEALALAKPVISSNINGIESFIDESCGLICDNNDQYVEGIINLLDDEEGYKKMSVSAEKKAEKMFDTDGYKRKIIEIYDSVID